MSYQRVISEKFSAVTSVLSRVSLPLLMTGTLIFIVGSFLLLSYVFAVFEWQRDDYRYKLWQSSDEFKACRTIGAKCSGPVPGKSQIYVPDGNPYTGIDVTGSSKDGSDPTAHSRLSSQLQMEKCFSLEESNEKLNCRSHNFDPGTIVDVFRRRSSRISETLTVWLLTVALLSSIRLILREPHIGWRRISMLLSSILAAIGGTIGFGADGPNAIAFPLAAVLGGCIGLVAPLVLRRLIVWVRAGFPEYRLEESDSNHLTYEKPLQLTWKALGVVVLGVLCVGGVAVVSLTSTESTLLAGISGAGLALIGWFLSRKRQ